MRAHRRARRRIVLMGERLPLVGNDEVELGLDAGQARLGVLNRGSIRVLLQHAALPRDCDASQLGVSIPLVNRSLFTSVARKPHTTAERSALPGRRWIRPKPATSSASWISKR